MTSAGASCIKVRPKASGPASAAIKIKVYVGNPYRSRSENL